MVVDEYNITSLTLDFERAVYDVMDYLTGLGHTKIALLVGCEYVGDGERLVDARTVAYKKYMEHREMDAETYVREGSFTAKSGYDMMMDLLDSSNLPTAVFAANDAIALGAMKAIKERGYKIPRDISIVGFNDEESSTFITPPLTTIHAPSYDMGQHGANLVYVASNLSIKTPLKAKIPCPLVIRESCARVKETADSFTQITKFLLPGCTSLSNAGSAFRSSRQLSSGSHRNYARDLRALLSLLSHLILDSGHNHNNQRICHVSGDTQLPLHPEETSVLTPQV